MLPSALLEYFQYFLAFFTLYVIVFFMLVFIQNFGSMQKDPRPPKKLPMITVLIPAFNEEATIAKTIESVLDSGYPKNKLEVIVIDDGSNDGTLNIAKGFVKHGVKVIHKENSGKAASLNLGISKAKGEFIATLDGDSFLKRGCFQSMLGYFARKEVAAVTSVMKAASPKNALERMQGVEYIVTVFSRKILSFLNSINVTPGPLSIFRKSVFDHVGGYDERNILEDQEMAMRIQSYDYKIESSVGAVVYTQVPSNLPSLVTQRVRWHRGGIRNILKHYYLVSPRYGDFGVFVMPVAILSILLVFAVFCTALIYFFTTNSISDFLTYGFDSIVFGISGLSVLAAIIFAATIVWAYLGIKSIRKEYVSPPFLLLYVVIYAPLITLFWIATAIKELKREKLRW